MALMYENGFAAVRSFPVEGDSAEYEIWRDGELFALVWLDRIDLDAVGETRITNARVMVSFFERSPRAAAADSGSKQHQRQRYRSSKCRIRARSQTPRRQSCAHEGRLDVEVYYDNGAVMIWVDDGWLSNLETWWWSDDPPKELPPLEALRLTPP
jgi:hypothetical protein